MVIVKGFYIYYICNKGSAFMTNTDSYIMKVKLKEIVKLMKGLPTGAVHERTLSFFDKLTCLGIQEN